MQVGRLARCLKVKQAASLFGGSMNSMGEELNIPLQQFGGDALNMLAACWT